MLRKSLQECCYLSLSLPLFEELLFPLPLLLVNLSQKSMFVFFTLQNLLFILPHSVSVLSVDESHDYLSVILDAIFGQPAVFSVSALSHLQFPDAHHT